MRRVPNILFFLLLPIWLIGAVFKIQHWPGARILLLSVTCLHVLLIVFCIYEIATTKAAKFDKRIWLSIFIGLAVAGMFFSPYGYYWLTLLTVEVLYLWVARKKILKAKKTWIE